MTEYADAIRARREAMGLSQVKLASVAGVSHGTIRNVEKGKPTEESTRHLLEVALGWRPGTTSPFISAEDMKGLADLILKHLKASEAKGMVARATIQSFLSGAATGEVAEGARERARALAAEHLPAAQVAAIFDAPMEGPLTPAWPTVITDRKIADRVVTDRLITDRAIADRAIADRLDSLAFAFPEDLFPDDERTPEAIRVMRRTYQHAARIARGEA